MLKDQSSTSDFALETIEGDSKTDVIKDDVLKANVRHGHVVHMEY